MTEFRPGDRVRVTVEAEYQQASINHKATEHVVNVMGDHYTMPYTADVELIERADDPSKDPLGTVRRCGDGEIWVHVKRDPSETAWRCVGEDLFEGNHRHMAGTEIIGFVPGTPAVEDADLLARINRLEKREPWTGDGSEEPPAHVKKVRDRYGDIAQRNANGRWDWIQVSGRVYSLSSPGWPLSEESACCGPFTEVVE